MAKLKPAGGEASADAPPPKKDISQMSLAEQLQAAQLKPVGSSNANRQSKDVSQMSLAE